MLGISSSINGKPYQFTAETLEACQISFVKCDDFVQFVQEYSDVCFRVAEQLSKEHHEACRGFRSHGLSYSVEKKLARLLLEWSTKNGESTKAEPHITVGFSHEEIAQMIGTSRETVTRLFATMKKRQIVQFKDSMLMILDQAALKALATE